VHTGTFHWMVVTKSITLNTGYKTQETIKNVIENSPKEQT